MTTAERVTDKSTGERYYVHPVTGDLLDSVTTVIAGTDSKPWLRDWYASTAIGWAADNIDLVASTLASDGRKAVIDLGRGAAERIRDLKADAGTYVHDVQEALILWAASPGRTGHAIALPVLPGHLENALYNDEPLADVVGFMVDGFINWVSDFGPRFLATEMAVYDPQHGVAGTLDGIAVLTGYALSPGGDQIIARYGNDLVICFDTKTGKSPEGTWKEQLAAYRRMKECRLPLGEVQPMPETHCGAVLHLRPEYPDGYLFMLVAGADDEAAWQRFQKAASIYRERQKVKDKPGRSIRPLRADGTMPGPRICDLAGEGYGRALAPLAKALGADTELELLATFTAAEVLAIKGVGLKLLEVIRSMLGAHGLLLRDDGLCQLTDALIRIREQEVA